MLTLTFKFIYVTIEFNIKNKIISIFIKLLKMSDVLWRIMIVVNICVGN